MTLLAFSGCRWEVGKLRFPTPIPTPTPTPTPLVISAVANEAAVEPVAASLAAQVASTAADALASSTADAAKNTAAIRKFLSAVHGDSQADISEISQAKKSLAAARDASRKAEAAVFFVDPESADELRAQPDPLGIGSVEGEQRSIEELQSSLEKLEALLADSRDAAKAGALLAAAKDVSSRVDQLESGMRAMAGAWETGDAANFRSKYFLSSPESAVARIFQGLLALAGDLLPANLAEGGTDLLPDIVSRVAAVREIYLGRADSADQGPALHALVQEASPLQAALTRASIARASALASVLEITPGNETAKAQLSPALEDVTRQLTQAAASLGIVVTTDGPQ